MPPPNKSVTNAIMVMGAAFFLLIAYAQTQRSQEQLKDTVTKEKIQKYLSNPKNNKPFMWVHVPYEYNTRNWVHFMSRKTMELNQPYLEMCLQSIIAKCDDSFNICIVDDSSFVDLIPNWSIDINGLADPTRGYVRQLAMTKLVYIYGGMITPISFACIKDLDTLYEKNTMDGKMFVCENIHSSYGGYEEFEPNSKFIGADKENPDVLRLIERMQVVCSNDYTAYEKFVGEFDHVCQSSDTINVVSGMSTGVKKTDRSPVTLYDLLENDSTLHMCPYMYGVWIPIEALLKNVKYGWFVRLSKKQILESNFMLANYLMVAIISDADDTSAQIELPSEPIVDFGFGISK